MAQCMMGNCCDCAGIRSAMERAIKGLFESRQHCRRLQSKVFLNLTCVGIWYHTFVTSVALESIILRAFFASGLWIRVGWSQCYSLTLSSPEGLGFPFESSSMRQRMRLVLNFQDCRQQLIFRKTLILIKISTTHPAEPAHFCQGWRGSGSSRRGWGCTLPGSWSCTWACSSSSSRSICTAKVLHGLNQRSDQGGKVSLRNQDANQAGHWTAWNQSEGGKAWFTGKAH